MRARDVTSSPVTRGARDGNELAPIPVAECWRLLATVPIGRMVFTESALPAVHPVNFAVADTALIIRTGPGAKLDAAMRGDVVAFEADGLGRLENSIV